MKLRTAIDQLGRDAAIRTVEQYAQELEIPLARAARHVFLVLLDNPTRTPKIGGKNDDEQGVIKKWLNKYKKGYEERASQRISKTPGTIADPIIEKLLQARVKKLSREDLKKISMRTGWQWPLKTYWG